MPGLLVCAFYLLPYFLLDQVVFLLKGIFPNRPKVWYGNFSIENYFFIIYKYIKHLIIYVIYILFKK